MSERDNKHKAVWNWLFANEEISALFFNFSTTEENDTVIAPIETSDNFVKKFIDGSSLRVYDFAIIQYKRYNSEVPNVAENAEIIFDVEKVMTWIEEQNRKRNFPVFPFGCEVQRIEILQDMPGATGINETNAKYMFSVRIWYTKKGA